jgi:hypothetical protein
MITWVLLICVSALFVVVAWRRFGSTATTMIRAYFRGRRIREEEREAELRIRDAEIDPNSKCPACGHRDGKLKCTFVEIKEKPNRDVMVQHTCNVCNAQWFEPTVLRAEKWVGPELLKESAS